MTLPEEDVLWKDRKHWLWFPFSFTKYQITKDRLYIQKGLFRTVYDETLLYRIVDTRLIRSLGQKICGTGTVEVFSRVDTQKKIELKNIRHCQEVKRLISDLVEQVRDNKKVIGKEFYGIMGHPHHDADEMDEFVDFHEDADE